MSRSAPVLAVSVSLALVADWRFVRVKTVRFDNVNSARSHTEAGVRAVIEVK